MKSTNVGQDHDLELAGSISIPRGNGQIQTVELQPDRLEAADISAVPSHPLGVKPSGNLYTATSNARHSIGYFQEFPDELLVSFLEFLEADDLRIFGNTCKALHTYCSSEELWKALFLSSYPSNFTWQGSWRSTYLNLQSDQSAFIPCSDLYSDILYRPFQCAHTSLVPYTTNIPRQNEIPRLSNLTPEDFSENWASKPFVLTEPVKEWPAYQSWDTEQLLEKYGDVAFRAEAVDWPLRTYVDYMNNQRDESPLYLFERGFVEKMDISVGKEAQDAGYWIPSCFGEDLFSLLGPLRPDSRWLIIGPARSGSTFHKDPNATSAWNAVLRGSKYWIMFPPSSSTPPGVFVSDDQSEVTSPLSIAEWLLVFHAEARRTPGCMESICGPGEVLHVPSGWWHLVVNLDDSIAITQNFVPRSHLTDAISFLKDKADQISGFKKEVQNPYAEFVARLREHQPQLLEQALAEIDRAAAARKRKWDETIGDKSDGEGFSFGFGDDDSDADIP